MIDNIDKKASGWIGVILYMIIMAGGFVYILPFNIYINILIAIVVVAISVGCLIFSAACLVGASKFQIPRFERPILKNGIDSFQSSSDSNHRLIGENERHNVESSNTTEE